jgi:hypothetical protein
MIELYQWYNHGDSPSDAEIQCFESCNKRNLPILDDNDPCKIAALIIKKEKQLNLNENERYWSAKDEFQNPDKSTLYQRIDALINPTNYGKSDMYLEGANLNNDTLWKNML